MNQVLIIDDNPMDVALQRRVLERSGRFDRIISSSDGHEAIELFRLHAEGHASAPEGFPPLIVLLDLNMPVLDGFGFLERFADLPPDVRSRVVIVLSSSNADRDRERIEATGLVDRYLVKPLTHRAVQEIANACLAAGEPDAGDRGEAGPRDGFPHDGVRRDGV